MRIILPFFLCFAMIGATAQSLYFPPAPVSGDPSNWETVDPASLGWCTDNIADFETYLTNSATLGTIILKDGRIAYEKYTNGSGFQNTVIFHGLANPVASLMAQISDATNTLDLDARVSSILGAGWTSAPRDKEDLILVRHLVDMTTGLITSDPTCATANCFQYGSDAGTEWNFNYGLFTKLIDVIRMHPTYANDINFAVLIQDLVNPNNPPSMNGSWRDQNGRWIMQGTARSMARMGLLTLARGQWANKTVLNSPEYYSAIFDGNGSPNQSSANLWWQNGKSSYQLPDSTTPVSGPLNPNAPASMISAYGIGGQFLDVVPYENLVVVRLTALSTGDLVPVTEHRQFWDELSKVVCGLTNVEEKPTVDESIAFPNPFDNLITIDQTSNIETVRIFDTFGKKVVEVKEQKNISVQHLPKGLYILEVTDNEQIRTVKKMMKQ